jgi:hypothetical protein
MPMPKRYEEEILSFSRTNVRIRVRFRSGHLLELNEAVIVKVNQIVHLGYRYHFQDEQHHLVFRYDDTPHFPDLPTFPHHKHLAETVLATSKPDILDVIKEANELAQ